MVIMGHVMGPFGVQGWIKVNPYTERIDGLMEFSSWWLSGDSHDWHQVQVTSGHVNGHILTAKLKGYADRTEASKLKGMQIAIPRDCLPVLSEKGHDGYYWSDLIGTNVTNLEGEQLGIVKGLLETGANDVLCVHNDSRTKEILIPFISQYVINVDLKLSKIIVDWNIDY
ncbi:ribosome maturation factor RimM [Nitrosomonas sp. JL21]|nr:ribosome maturation factor RimM [Nitrosomonas sp. JL21]MBL8496937.1 ribosome maturation factor RimM [Nitrosomonas sp.]MCC7091675.1 ribosome maturation factor RimM [Nitrosomonas sp.]MXS78510.1 ribosome maturation factor RimM [Nitrosomonas sp. JL21]